MAPKCLPLELLYEFVPFIPAENATPNALSSCWLLHNFLLPRVIKWKEMTDLKEFRNDILDVFKNFREEFHQKMDNFRDEFNQKLDNFRDEFNQKLDNFRDEFNQKLEKVHDESNQKFDSLNKRVDLLSQVVNNVAIDVAILKTNAPRTMAKRQSNSSLTVLEKVNDVIKAETMTGTILALGRHLVQFGKVSKSVFDTFDTLTESTDEEFSKQIKMMRKLCSDLVEGWTRLKVNVAKDASVKQAFCFFAGRLKKLELHAVAELERLATELSDESKSAAESLRESFFVLSTAFNNALAKFAVPSREMSPVLIWISLQGQNLLKIMSRHLRLCPKPGSKLSFFKT